MQSLFLGLGKVNVSLSALVQGEKIGLVEEESSVAHYEWKGGWCKTKEIPGSFDTIQWRSYLPASVFVSPGIDPRRPFFKHVCDFEIRELDFFCERFKGQVIAITGTDGKSTFTTQLGEVLKRALPQTKIFVGGNLGIAMGEGLKEEYDLAVLEISSFQAERLRSAQPQWALLLNLAVDHLDRYDSLKEYYEAKWNLLRQAQNVFYPLDIPSLVSKPTLAPYKNNESLSSILKKAMEYFSTYFHFQIREDLFENCSTLPHRLQMWNDPEGRLFVNDSKSTTVHAVQYALTTFRNKISKIKLILGGRYKGDDFSQLLLTLNSSDSIYICGEAKEIISEHLNTFLGEKIIYPSLKELLLKQLPKVKPQECLLLSPGCSSFDEFKNFEERGQYFESCLKKFFQC